MCVHVAVFPSACGEVIRRPQGHVTLESYPINAKCEWMLHVGRGLAMEFRQFPFYLKLTYYRTNLLLNVMFFISCRFTRLNLEFDYRCRYDFVELRDGDSIHSPLIGRYCGDKIPPPIRSSGNSLHIHFVSDGYNNYDGFSATFQELSGAVYKHRYLCVKTTECIFITEHTAYVLTSLDFCVCSVQPQSMYEWWYLFIGYS